MKFTQDQLNQFKQIWAEGKELTIKGINNFGEPFETTGRITTDDKGHGGIYENTLYIEYGTEKDSPTRKQTKWFAPYTTEYRDSIILDHFVIFSIECEGKTLFENPEKEEIKQKAEENAKDKIKKSASEGRDRIIDCPVVDFLKTKIGQPIRIKTLVKSNNEWEWDVTDAVLLGIVGCTYSGYPIIELRDGPGVTNCFVEPTTQASGVEDDMSAVRVVRNDIADFEEKRAEIVDNIESLTAENENV